MRVALGMVLSVFLLPVLLRLVSDGILLLLLGARARLCPCFVIWLVLFSISRRGGPLVDLHGSMQLLNSSHVRERDKALLRSIMVGECLEWFSP